MGARAAYFGQISTGPQCGSKKPHPTKQTLCRVLFKVPLHQKTGQDLEFYLPAQGGSQYAMSSHVYIQNTRGHKPAKGLPLPGLVFTRLCSSTMARGRCVSPSCNASFTVSHQARSRVITGVHQFGYQLTVAQNSTSLCLVHITSVLTSALLGQVCGTMEGKRQMKQIYTQMKMQPLFCFDNHIKKDSSFTSQENGISLRDRLFTTLQIH